MGVDCLNITSQSQCKFIADKTWTPNAFFNPLLSSFQFHSLWSFWYISSFEMNMTPVLCLDQPHLWYPNSFYMASREILHLCTCMYAHTQVPTTGEGSVSIRQIFPGGKTPTMMNSQKIHKILYPDSQVISFTKLWHCSHRVSVISL